MHSVVQQVQTLPLFTNVDTAEIHAVMTHANTIELACGQTIFLQNDPARYFYILLNGKIKLHRSNSEGDEVVLAILTPDSPFLDITVLHSMNHTAHAQALMPVTLLALPIVMFRRAVNQHHTLNANMATLIMQHYQESLAHCEQLSYQSTLQRVGWFLLRLFINDGWKQTVVSLPFEKYLIANYLGMKPESFSRALRQLKNTEITMTQKTVSLLNQSALCGYCTPDLAQRCQSSTQQHCFQKENLCFARP